jgi:hypothetical protein
VARTFYRIVKSDPPTEAEFLSDRARGRPLPADPALRRLHDGLSVYASLVQARRKAKAFPLLGGLIAVVRLPDGSPVAYERTLQSSGHHTLWGEAATLLGYVEAVVGVEESSP